MEKLGELDVFRDHEKWYFPPDLFDYVIAFIAIGGGTLFFINLFAQ
jgi:hypothetical protein